MNKLKWKEICRKTKYASKKHYLTKKELNELVANVTALEKFIIINKSNFEGTVRKTHRYF